MRWRRWRCCAVGREYEEVAPVSHIFFGKKRRRRRNANRCQGFPPFFRLKNQEVKAPCNSIRKEGGGRKRVSNCSQGYFYVDFSFCACTHDDEKVGKLECGRKSTHMQILILGLEPSPPPVLFARNPYLTLLLSKGASLRCRPRRRQRFFAHCHPQRFFFFANHGFRTLHHGRRKILDIFFYLDWSSDAKKKPLFSPKLH